MTSALSLEGLESEVSHAGGQRVHVTDPGDRPWGHSHRWQKQALSPRLHGERPAPCLWPLTSSRGQFSSGPCTGINSNCVCSSFPGLCESFL